MLNNKPQTFESERGFWCWQRSLAIVAWIACLICAAASYLLS